MSVAPVETARPEEDVETGTVVVPDKPWVTIVWNDPVNLMSYVAYVFQKHFGYTQGEVGQADAGRAREGPGRRLQRHPRGDGARRRAMHGYGLWATLQHDE